MKAFEWENAKTVEEAVKLLAPGARGTDPDDAPRAIAGGQDLVTSMQSYISRPPRVVNLKTIQGLDGIEGDAKTGLRIGALVTLSDLEAHPEVQKNFPGLAEAAGSVGTPQIRNLGTVGGNLCQRPRCWYFRLEHVICIKKGGSECYAAADNGENKYNAILGGGPSYIVHPSDLAPMLVALDAKVTIAGKDGKREMALAEFFTLPSEGNVRRENVLKNDEIVTQVMIPPTSYGMKNTYLKFRERDSMDFALSAVAVAAEIADDKSAKRVRIVLGGVAPIPWAAPKAEELLKDKTVDADLAAQAAKAALDGAEPLGKNEYKIPLTQTLVRRALAKVCDIQSA